MGGEDSKRHNMENCLWGIAESENRLMLNNGNKGFIGFANKDKDTKLLQWLLV